jgi:TolA-binding protein
MARQLFIATLVAVVLLVGGNPSDVSAEIPSRLRRIDIRPRPDHTRLIFQLDRETPYSVAELPGNRLKVTFLQADAPLFRRLRSYSDQHVKGITVAQRGDLVQVTIGKSSPGEGIRVIDSSTRALTLDIGPRFRGDKTAPPILKGRESIWNGAGRFIKEYDPPVKSELPFVPTDQKALRPLLGEDDTKLFLAGEASIYKGQSTDAVSIFSSFMEKDSGIGALAAYRCGQAYYNLLEYDRALQMFRKGEALWPQFLEMSPDVKFAYADCLVRGGDLPAGRKLLSGLIASKAEKNTAPILLVRLADILARQQRESEARIIYGNVIKFFPDNKAAVYSALKLADRQFLEVDTYSYPGLRDEYLRLAKVSSDFTVREEAFFKAALLDSLFGSGMDALIAVSDYEKRYPRGVLASLARSMHLDLMPVVYRELMAAGDEERFVKTMERNVDYLSKCMTEPAFVSDLDKSFAELGLIQDENRLFGRLARRDWTLQQAPFLYGKILDNSIALADWKLAEATGREFIQKFPALSQTQRVRELMGDIGYRKGDMKSVAGDLAFLMDPKVRAGIPESYYYLGKSLESAGQVKQAGKVMELYIAATQSQKSVSPLVADAHFVAGTSYLADRNPGKAMASFNAGLGQATQEGRDRFIYKIAELQNKEGRSEDAKKSWGKIVKDGKDPVWQKLAAQELAEVEWKEKTRAGI